VESRLLERDSSYGSNFRSKRKRMAMRKHAQKQDFHMSSFASPKVKKRKKTGKWKGKEKGYLQWSSLVNKKGNEQGQNRGGQGKTLQVGGVFDRRRNSWKAYTSRTR